MSEEIKGVFVGTKRGAKKYMMLHGLTPDVASVTLGTAKAIGEAAPMSVPRGTFIHVTAYAQKGLIFTTWRYVVVRGRDNFW